MGVDNFPSNMYKTFSAKMKLILASSFLLTLTSASGQCGKVYKSRIVGGREADRGAYPWQISLRSSRYGHFCGGSIISDRWILTASHCLYEYEEDEPGRTYFVAIGAHKLYGEGRDIIETVKTVIHPKYKHNNGYDPDHDIALLKLSEKIDFGPMVQPICLHEAGLPTPKQVTVSGWGHTSFQGDFANVLMGVTLPMVSKAKCRQAYGRSLTDNMICAGAPQGGLDSCQGDSGGPLVYRGRNGRWVQIGVVSWGAICGDVGYPGVYADVGQYSDWIAKEMSEADEGSDQAR